MSQQVCKGRATLVSTTNNLDNASFDFIFEATGSDTTLDFTAAINPNTVIHDFFNTVWPPGGYPVAAMMAAELSRSSNTATISWTDITNHLDGSPAGSPFRTDNWTLAAATAGQSTLPLDAAIVCSYRADYGSAPEKGAETELPTPDDAIDYGAPPTHMGQMKPRARLRGRFYVGPLNAQTLATTGGLISSGGINTFTGALGQLLSVHNNGSHNQFEMVIWSRRSAAVSDPTHYFVSEAFGSVRRRGDVSFPRVHNWQPIPLGGP